MNTAALLVQYILMGGSLAVQLQPNKRASLHGRSCIILNLGFPDDGYDDGYVVQFAPAETQVSD